MKFKEFCEEIKRTLPNLDDFYQLKNPTHSLPRHALNLVHMRLGIVSEVSELMLAIHKGDKINIGEELGDFLWYIGNDLRVSKAIGLIPEEIFNRFASYEFNRGMQATHGGFMTIADGVNHSLWAIIYNASELADYSKKYLAYTKPLEYDKYVRTMEYLLAAINNIAYHLKVDLYEYMQKVVDKLKKRYPEKFDVEKAQNRDLLKERAALEREIEENNPHLDSERRTFSAMQEGTDGG